MLHGLRDRSVHALMIIINVYHIVYIHLGKTPMLCEYGNELNNKLELELEQIIHFLTNVVESHCAPSPTCLLMIKPDLESLKL